MTVPFSRKVRVEFKEVRLAFFKVTVAFSRKIRVEFREVRARGLLRKVRVASFIGVE